MKTWPFNELAKQTDTHLIANMGSNICLRYQSKILNWYLMVTSTLQVVKVFVRMSPVLPWFVFEKPTFIPMSQSAVGKFLEPLMSRKMFVQCVSFTTAARC